MGALADLQAAQAALDKAVSDAVASIQKAVAEIQALIAAQGTAVAAADLKPIIDDLTARATALEAAAGTVT